MTNNNIIKGVNCMLELLRPYGDLLDTLVPFISGMMFMAGLTILSKEIKVFFQKKKQVSF